MNLSTSSTLFFLACASCLALSSCDKVKQEIQAKIDAEKKAEEEKIKAEKLKARKYPEITVAAIPPIQTSWQDFIQSSHDGRYLIGRQFPSQMDPWRARFRDEISIVDGQIEQKLENHSVDGKPWNFVKIQYYELAWQNEIGWSITQLKGLNVINETSYPFPFENVELIRDPADGKIKQKVYNPNFRIVNHLEKNQPFWDSYIPNPEKLTGALTYYAIGDSFTCPWLGWAPGISGGEGTYKFTDLITVATQPSAVLNVAWKGNIPISWTGLDEGTAEIDAKGKITISLPLGIILDAELTGPFTSTGVQDGQNKVIHGNLTYKMSILE